MTKEQYNNLKEGDYVICIDDKYIEPDFTINCRYKVIGFYENRKGVIVKNNTDEVIKINFEDNLKDRFNVETPMKERVNHPDYYNSLPNGIECIDVVRYHDFDTGSAIKYLWRAGLKTEEGISNKQKEIEDLNKAIWYIEDRIKELSK